MSAYQVITIDTKRIKEDLEKKSFTAEDLRNRRHNFLNDIVQSGLEIFEGTRTLEGFPETLLIGGSPKVSLKDDIYALAQKHALGEYVGHGESYQSLRKVVIDSPLSVKRP